MISISIINNKNGREYGAQFETQEELDSWKQEQIDKNSWGLPERWKPELDCSAEELTESLESRLANEGTEDEYTEHRLPCHYEITETDLGDSIDFEKLRAERNKKLQACDWTQLADSPLTAQEKTDWVTYRQSLRDLPANTVDPKNPVWPQEPA